MTRIASLFLLSLPLLAGCVFGGDDDDDGGGDLSCQTFAACGGDVVGDWSFEQVCIEGELGALEGCPAATVEYSPTVNGTASFAEDGNFTMTVDLGGTATYHIPMSCLEAGATCDDLAEAGGVACVTNGDACDCEGSLDDEAPEASNGTWTTNGTTLTTTDGAEEPTTLSYCVEGDVLAVEELVSEDDGSTVRFTLVR